MSDAGHWSLSKRVRSARIRNGTLVTRSKNTSTEHVNQATIVSVMTMVLGAVHVGTESCD